MATSPSIRYQSIEHWRGIAALLVVMIHSYPLGGGRFDGETPWSLVWLKNASEYGWFGVYIFFVISGFCITANIHNLAKSHLGIVDFLRDRALRIYPTYWGALLFTFLTGIAALYFNHQGWNTILPPNIRTGVANLFLIEPYVHGAYAYLAVSWTLVLELGFYVIMAIGFWLYRKGWKVEYIFLTGLVLAIAGQAGIPLVALYVLKYFWAFFMGCAVFAALYYRSRGNLKTILSLLSIAVLVITGCFLFQEKKEFWILVFTAATSYTIFFLQPLDEKIFRMKSLLWLCWVGTFSYTLYLVHYPIANRTINIGLRWADANSPLSIWILQLFTWATCIGICWGFYRICEYPLEKWRHSLRKKKST